LFLVGSPGTAAARRRVEPSVDGRLLRGSVALWPRKASGILDGIPARRASCVGHGTGFAILEEEP
jgi:hypothetical protein